VRLAGLTALITGGASGIGRAVAKTFLAEGARVAVFDRSASALSGLADAADVLTIEGDVRSLSDNQRAVTNVVRTFGKLDVFVGNAGIFDNNVTLDDLPADGGDAAFDELFGIDVKGYLFGAKAAVEAVRASRGTMIFTASVSGVHPAFGGVLYVPAKHAIVGLTKRLALELAPHVRVNAVAPGFVPTDLAGTSALGQRSKSKERSADEFLMKRVPTVEDYAPLYTFLASSDSITMTGQVLVAENGAMLPKG
jgi:NAD(P)-dependent dehydrogenase (short-subunit alcohol dehydrogenase family)